MLTQEMVKMAELNHSRRDFLKMALVTTGAAVATGTGAALLWPLEQDVTKVVTSASSATSSLPAGGGAVAAAVGPSISHNELMERLTAAQAENLRLQAELDGALRRLQAWETADQQPDQAVNLMQEQLAQANTQIMSLAGLVALYEELESVDVQGVLTQGTTAVSASFQNLLDQLPTLDESVAQTHQALSELEAQLPLLENGRAWLTGHLESLAAYQQAVERGLATAVNRAGPILDMLQQWFDDILKWLPFGMGQNASNVMAALREYMQQGPVTLQGLNTNIAQPLDTWLKPAPGQTEAPLVRQLVKPIREKTLTHAAHTITQAQAAHQTYQEQLVTQMATQMATRQMLEQLISEYRQQHQV
jgi:hypothetical protein